MAERTFTPEQLSAIRADGGPLLLSAAAGSGKTSVLVERVIRMLTDPEKPVDADRLLIATFSNAAAGEMKERIAARLAQLLEQEPSNRLLRRQQLLLERASISTIHAFCLDLIRENFQRLAISPDFRIADTNEADILFSQAMEEVVEEYYSNEDETFFQLVELISTSRDDRRLFSTISDLYRFVRAIAFYNDWLEEKLSLYQPGQRVEQSVWAQILFDEALGSLTFAKSQLREALQLMEGDAALTDKYRPSFEEDLALLSQLCELVEQREWDSIYRALHEFEFLRLKALTKYPDENKKQKIRALRESAKDIVKNLGQDFFNATAAQFSEDIEDLYPKVQKLFELTLACDDRFTALKYDKKLLDFSDLEHLAIKLLTDRQNGKTVPSALAQSLSRHYEEILVDEYQDTNQAQELIFSMLSRGGKNLFMVGDVKQSIYRFRQAMPEIFLEKKRRYPLFDGEHYPAKILLNRNFRSRREVTGAINFLFGQMMSEKVGEICYDDSEKLIPSAQYPESPLSGVQVHLLDLPSEIEDPTAVEAAMIAKEILALLQSGIPVYENGQFRPIRQKDIVILLRSPKGRADVYRKALTEAGISAWADSQSGFLESREIASLLALLRVVDNPLLDIPLAAALVSPLFGFTADELAKIRLEDRGQPLYRALVKHSEQDEKCKNFLKELSFFREQSFSLPSDALIRLICERTGFFSTVQFLSNPQVRKNNLNLLIEYAYQYESRGYKGLSGFLRFVDKIEERKGDLAPASPVGDASDLVRIMSIHRSKGLEFPVVFLADCTREFNRSDLRQNTLLHPNIGFACVRRDREGMRQFSTVPWQAMKLEIERSMLSEEMRVLYVALTRAKERLVLVGSVKGLEGRLEKAVSATVDGQLPPYAVQKAKSYLDWLLPSLLCHQDGKVLWDYCGLSPDFELHSQEECRFQIAIRKEGETAAVVSEPEQEQLTIEPDPELVAVLRERFAYRYPFQEATTRPTKLAVSDLAKQAQNGQYSFTKRPSFLLRQGLSPTEKGNATHKFMQFCDYASAKEDIRSELARLVEQRFLLPAEGEAISLQALEGFFSSPLADRIFKADKVYRELRFLSLVTPDGKADEELCKTAVQGVADCVFVEQGHAVVVDFKTDRVKKPEVLAERYRMQLLLYRDILTQTLGMPVDEMLLYSFELGQTIPILD